MVLGIETKGRDVASLVAEANQRIKEGVTPGLLHSINPLKNHALKLKNFITT